MIEVGTLVKVMKWIGRVQPVVEIYYNRLGTKLFILADGGIFRADEIEKY
jgi:hypothetical protein